VGPCGAPADPDEEIRDEVRAATGWHFTKKKAERPIDPDRDLGWGIGIGSKLPESTIC